MERKEIIQQMLFDDETQIFRNRNIIINKAKFIEVLDEL